MRRFVVVAVAAALAGTPLVANAATSPGTEGIFSDPFHEPFPDGVERETAAPTSTCYTYTDGGSKRTDCLPSGASQNVLADGRILYWNAIEGSEDNDGPVGLTAHTAGADSRSRLLGLDGGGPTWKTPANERGYFPGADAKEPSILNKLDEPSQGGSPDDRRNDGSLFCSDNTFLPDGQVLTVGGTDYYAEPGVVSGVGLIELEGLKSARVFDPAQDTWLPKGRMHHGRWYPSLVSLADGRVAAFSGVTKLLKPAYHERPRESGRNVAESETYDPATGTWTRNGDEFSLPLYPRLHLLPNGKVYYDAAGQAFNPAGQSYDEALWNIAAVFDPQTKKWSPLPVPGAETGDPAQVGFRGSTFSQMLVLEAPYDRASFLSAGGVVGTTPGSYVPTAASRINTVAMRSGGETLTTTATGPLGRPRWYGSGVTLPSGEVVVFSGGDLDHVVSPGSEKPIRTAEIFDPIKKTWRDAGTARVGRTYHNAAVLLPDGRVLVGGHDPIPEFYGPSRSGSSFAGHADNRPNATFEIYTPPYLVGRERPVIADAPASLTYGTAFGVRTRGPVKGTHLRLVRNPSITHLVDADQRVVDIPVERSGNGVRATLLDDPKVLPPGPYMLFVLSADGTPSVSRQVFVGPSTEAAGAGDPLR